MSHTALIDCENPRAKVQCDNCSWRGTAEGCVEVNDPWDRLTAGCTVPAGECPECGGLAYLVKPPTWMRKEVKARKRLIEASRAILQALDGEEDSVKAEHRKVIRRFRTAIDGLRWWQ